MYKCLLILMSLFAGHASAADQYFECDQPADPLVSKACAAPVTVEKARRFNANFLQIFALVKTYDEAKPAVKIKNDYRNDAAACRAAKGTFTSCIEAALDKASAALNSTYRLDTDVSNVAPDTLKEAAHTNASLLKDQARKVPAQCLKDEAKKLDDLVSPASNIAQAVAQACKPKATEFVTFANDTLILWDVLNSFSRMNGEQVNDMSERSFGQEAASKVVLESRVEKYKADANSKAKSKKKKRKTTAKQ